MARLNFISELLSMSSLMLLSPTRALALQSSPSMSISAGQSPQIQTNNVLFQDLELKMNDYGVKVPVACWFSSSDATSTVGSCKYAHRISVRKIGQLLAKWDFIPELLSRDFELEPGVPTVCADSLPATTGPVVLLCHGYLGSRFDLSHLAEKLALEGFTCLAVEYPESLSANYDIVEGLSRKTITDELIGSLEENWGIKGTSFGIVGHSLGCGTVMETGDDRWARVMLAGFPRTRDGSPVPGNMLFIASMNDGAVSLQQRGGKAAIPADFTFYEDEKATEQVKLPSRTAIVYEPNLPNDMNHISFLSEGVNDAMIDLLSPLLPVAQAFSIPVLDFDRYKESKDSKTTANLYQPVVVRYLKEQMKL